jgi:ring-1,2-phenylacetyl-CoA epoxidase subunit PaaC
MNYAKPVSNLLTDSLLILTDQKPGEKPLTAQFQIPNSQFQEMIQPTNQSTNPLISYTLHLADNALILGQRNAEWTGHGPVLEQDIAISNIALDLVGQARNLYQYAATLINQSTNQPINPSTTHSSSAPIGGGREGVVTEDTLAYLRDSGDFKNCLLAELDRGDWARTVLRQFFFSNYQCWLYEALQKSREPALAAVAEKSLKEVIYHLRWSAEWVIRLGDGTAESHQRITNALHDLWPYTGELMANASYEKKLSQVNIAVDLDSIKQPWLNKTTEVLREATLELPQHQWMQGGGKEGRHTEHLGYVLAEMQYLQRTYPGVEW